MNIVLIKSNGVFRKLQQPSVSLAALHLKQALLETVEKDYQFMVKIIKNNLKVFFIKIIKYLKRMSKAS